MCVFFSVMKHKCYSCWEGIYYLCFTARQDYFILSRFNHKAKKYICVFQVSALKKKLGMVGRHNILFCQNILYRNCIFSKFDILLTDSDSSVGRVSAPGNGRSWVRSRDKVFKNGTSCSSLGTQIYGVELVGLVDPVSG